MEAETYLSSGYGLRLAFEEKATGWVPLSQLARVWQPLRLKGTLVPEGIGTPFLAATQVFDLRPTPRKWLAIEQTSDAANRFVDSGTIVVTCSGAVGRATLVGDAHAGMLISHDLLRVEPRSNDQSGWIYSYLRSPQARAMMTGAQYGHIIKHLETSHLDALPIPVVRNDVAADFQRRVLEILVLRNRAYALTLEAETLFEKRFNGASCHGRSVSGFEVFASNLFSMRRRLEATVHSPVVSDIRKRLAQRGIRFDRLSQTGLRIWLPNRFKRIPASDGALFVDSSDLFEVNPDITRRIADGNNGDNENARVEPGWLLVARSGQTYGINGQVVISTVALQGAVVSDDVVRIAPTSTSSVRVGYLATALGHPKLGQPLIKALAYGSSIPHIDPADLYAFDLVRLPTSLEQEIADLAEAAVVSRANADILERKLGADAEILVNKFLLGDTHSFVMTSQRRSVVPRQTRSAAFSEHARVRLLRAVGEQPKGAIGAVVHVYAGERALEVEFVKAKKLPNVLTVAAKDVELLNE